MINIMTTKSLKKFTELLHRNEGISLTPIIVIMVLMSIMGGVFTSIMGGWKVSAPLTVNSNKAFFQAETAAMFALQDAQYRFYSKDAGGNSLFNFGTSTAVPYVVSSVTTGNITEEADYWFEMPNAFDDVITGTNDDTLPDDDDDDSSNPTRYTIVATGTVKLNGATTAKRQIKIKADITDNSGDPIDPGIHAEGSLRGSGSGAFQIWQDGLDVGTDTASVAFSNSICATSSDPPSSCPDNSCRAGVVYQSPAYPAPVLDEEFFKAIAADQGHTNPSISNNSTYPVGSSSYYYDAPTNTMPNITYISSGLSVNNVTLYGIYYVTGAVAMQGNVHIEGIIIGKSTIKLSASGAASDPHLEGGIIQLGSGQIWGAGNPSTVQINDAFFDAMNNTMPVIDVQSWQEAVSAN